MFLAKCINASYSDGLLLLGEYYMLAPSFYSTFGQTRVHVYSLADSEIVAENFVSPGMGFNESGKLRDLKDRKPFYTTVLHRFEILVDASQLEAAIHLAKERATHTSGGALR